MDRPKNMDDKNLPDDYKEYINSPEWQGKRSERLRMDNFRCQKCGSTRSLQVHHTTYQNFKHENVATDLITLCKLCHELIEYQKTEEYRIEKEKWDAYIAENKERNARIQEYTFTMNGITAEFIALCDMHKMDYADKGKYNMCDYGVIKPLFNKYLERYHLSEECKQCASISRIQKHFIVKRYLKIKELRSQGWRNFDIQREYHFTTNMLTKPDSKVNQILKEEQQYAEAQQLR